MPWYYLYDNVTGRLLSESSREPEQLRPGAAVLERENRRTQSEIWDESVHSFVAAPPALALVDRLTDLQVDPDYARIWASLSDRDQQSLESLFDKMLGGYRYRGSDWPAFPGMPPVGGGAEWPVQDGSGYIRRYADGQNYSLSVTTSSTANDKGSYEQLVERTANEAHWVQITLNNAATDPGESLIDIAKGDSGAEQIIIPDLVYSQDNHTFAWNKVTQYQFPIHIPAGTRLSARAQSSRAGADNIALNLYLGTNEMLASMPFSRVLTMGAQSEGVGDDDSGGLEVDPGGTSNTYGGWVEFHERIPHDFHWIALAVGGQGQTSRNTGLQWAFNIGIGDSGSEIVKVPDISVVRTAVTIAQADFTSFCFPCYIPSGRVAVQAKCNGTATPGRTVDVVLYGVG